jgi:hypothetical protein
MARNPISKGGKQWSVEFLNFKETQKTFRKISDSVSGVSGVRQNTEARSIIDAGFKEVSEYLRDKIRSVAVAKGVPRRVQAAIFAFTDMSKGSTRRKKLSTLVGVRKGAPPRTDTALYKTWGGKSKRGGGFAITLGESLSTMFEKGTSRGIKPARYFRTGLFASKSHILQRLTAAYKTAIESFNR